MIDFLEFMLSMYGLPLILWMAFLSRLSGGGFFAHLLNKRGEIDDATGLDKGGIVPFISLSMLPEILFGATMGLFFYYVLHVFGVTDWQLITRGGHYMIGHCLSSTVSVAVAVRCYLWMETGHGIVLTWGGLLPYAQRFRTQTLSPVVDWLADKLGIQKVQEDGYSRTLNYCRLFMAVKGFLIGLPFGGVFLALWWPASYEAGARLRGKVPFDSHALTELVAGAGTGIHIKIGVVAFIMLARLFGVA